MDLHHVRAGSGPPLLLLHGIGMSHRAWDDVVPALAGGFECFAADLPGFGASAPLTGPATMRALADACAAFMATQGHARFQVAGNSLGGGIALHLALDGRARSACGLSPVGFAAGWERAWAHVVLAVTKATGPASEAAAPLIGRSATARRALLAIYAAHGDRLTPGRYRENFEILNGATGFADTRRHALNWQCPTRDLLPCPVTVAWGALDRLLVHGPQSARALERLPRARHVTMPDIGHLPTWDDPAFVARVVREAATA